MTLLEKPAHALFVLCSIQLTLWTLIPVLTYDAPPLDVVEGYLWGKELVLGSYKHPALPSWVLELGRRLTGATGWPAYLTSQLFVVATFAAVFGLGRDLLGDARALAGVALLTGIVFFSWTTPNFNHDVALMPIWAGFCMALWRAVETNRPVCWCFAAVMAAAAVHTKLVGGVMCIVGACWLLWDDKARARLAQLPAWFGLLVFIVLVTPMALWLRANGHLLVEYGASRAYGRSALGVVSFVLRILASAAGVPLLLGAAVYRVSRAADAKVIALDPASEREARARQYLVAMTFGPLLLIMLLAKLSGGGLRTSWAAPMLGSVGLWAMTFVEARHADAVARVALRLALGAVVVVAASHAIYVRAAPVLGRPDRASWPAAEISHRLAAAWRDRTGQPLRIVAGEPWVAGLVGIGVRPMPSILTFGDLTLSPWITPERLAMEGALIVWGDHQHRTVAAAGESLPPPPTVSALVGDLPIEVKRFQWPQNPALAPISIGYAILPPSPAPGATSKPRCSDC